ncbi:MAG: phosphomannomutase/phosphoglucomutase [Anaerolineae bacterium]|nr:phosphomannomutase/phosphoglucomutase [Anaerolineae bacterium]MDW8173434.1 phosphomannomutase/phosphoglucomutase [Anaerolineae bacterium]
MMFDPSLFKKYDVRGVAQGDQANLTTAAAQAIGQAFATYLQRQHQMSRVVIGRDNRLSSYDLQEAFMEGLAQAGSKIIDIGLVSTPLVYWHAVREGGVGGVMVTGSHLAPHYNGFKLCLGAENLWGEVLRVIGQMAQARDFTYGRGASERTVNTSAYSQYIRDIAARVQVARRLKVVVDAGNGTSGVFAPRLLELWGQEVIGLYLEPDGRYPNHLPNPQEAANVAELGRKVRECGADLGLAFDGDADRVGVVDEQGRLIPADRILALLARDLLNRHPNAAVVGEVLCSQVLFDVVRRHGGVPHLAPSGHSIVKDHMRRVGALLGGEMSGHIFLAEDFYGVDDAYLVAGRLLALLAAQDQPLSALDDSLPRLYATPEYRPACPDEHKAPILQALAQSLAAHGTLNLVDGVRVEFERGWGIVRASNTEPVLSLRFEGQTEADASAYRDLFFGQLAQHGIHVQAQT